MSYNNTPYNGTPDSKFDFKKKKRKVYLNVIDGSGYDGISPADPLGMYTGVPENPYDEPVQDADDL